MILSIIYFLSIYGLHFISFSLIIVYWFCYYSCPDFSFLLCAPPPSIPTPSGGPHICSPPWNMRISSMATPFPTLYFAFPQLFCNYLFVLNPLTSSPIPPLPFPSGNHQNTLRIHDSVSVLLVCLVCFLDSVVDRYEFICILSFIVLIFS